MASSSSGSGTTKETATSANPGPSVALDCIVGDVAYTQMEQSENEALHLSALPAEMLIKIMAKLDTPDLVRGTMRVCKRWNLVSKQVLLDQVREIDERQLWIKRDLRAYLHALHSEAVAAQCQLINSASTPRVSVSAQFLHQMQHVKLLMFFHRTHFDSHDEVGLQWDSVRNLVLEEEITEFDKSFVRGLTRAYSRDYHLLFMPCHNLILLPTDENLKFFAESPVAAISNTNSGSDTPEDLCTWREYAPSAQNRSARSKIAERVSVYEDIILAMGTTRKSVLYIRVVEVDHRNKKVVLNFMREIFTPFFINTSLYFSGKIYIQYGNSPFLGVWKESSDILDLSETRLGASGDGDRQWSMSRIGNIIFFVPPSVLWADTASTWKCLDGNEDNMQLHDVEMSALVLSIQPNLRDRAYGLVSMVHAFNNIFIAICTPLPGASIASRPVAPMLILASVMKRRPKIEDFSSVERFKSLFYLQKTKTLKLMGSFRSGLFYFLNGINLLGEDDGGAFLLRVQKTFISEA